MRPKTTRNPITNNHTSQFGLDYQLNEKATIGGLIAGYDNKWSTKADNQISQKENGQETEMLQVKLKEENRWQHLMGNVYLDQKLASGQQLSFNFDYLHYNNHNPTHYSNEYINPGSIPKADEEVRVNKITPINRRLFRQISIR